MKRCMLALMLALTGCAHNVDQRMLEQARAQYQSIANDAEIAQRSAKHLARAGESLARAERFNDYLGSAEDVNHYAYLSLRYGQIAKEQTELEKLQLLKAAREKDQSRLEHMQREAQLIDVQEKNAWLEDQMLSLAASETERGLVMTLEGVLFEAGSTELGRGAHRSVLRLRQFLHINPKRIIRIEGYTDSLGRADENQVLSLRRAQSVAQALIDLGIDSRRILVRGYGEAYPIAENASARGRAQNRRVEVVFSDEQGQLGAERQ